MGSSRERGSRGRRWLAAGVTLAILVGLASVGSQSGVGAALLSALVFPRGLGDELVVVSGRIQPAWARGLSITDLKLVGPEGDTVMRIDTLSARVRWRGLMGASLEVGSLLLSGMHLEIRRSATGTWGFAGARSTESPRPGESRRAVVALGMEVRRSVLRIRHEAPGAPPGSFEAGLEASADLVVFQPSLAIENGRLSLRFEDSTEAALTISTAIDLANRTAAIRRLTLQSLESRVDAFGGIRLTPDGDVELRGFTVRGKPLAARDVAMFFPRLRGSSAVRDVDVFVDGSLDDLRRRLYPESMP